MKLEIQLHGGPLDKHKMDVATIDDVRLLFSTHGRLVLCYKRFEDSLHYTYDSVLSLKLTQQYDQVLKRFGPKIQQYELRKEDICRL